jgi:hypothetical protein
MCYDRTAVQTLLGIPVLKPNLTTYQSGHLDCSHYDNRLSDKPNNPTALISYDWRSRRKYDAYAGWKWSALYNTPFPFA